MLKLIRYILLKRRERINERKHVARLHKISSDDLLGRALWHCKDCLIHCVNLSIEERRTTTVVSKAPTIGSLIEATDGLNKLLQSGDTTNVRYIKTLPDWCVNDDIPRSVDTWLVDKDGYYAELITSLQQLHDNIDNLQLRLSTPDKEDLRYHYQKKPVAVYDSIIKTLIQFR